MSDDGIVVPDLNKMTPMCVDCPASLACIAGNIAYGIWCTDCHHVFVRIGREGQEKQEIKVPWQLRHFCRHNRKTHGEPNSNFDAWPHLNRCKECSAKFEEKQVRFRQQRIFMTQDQYDDLVDSLKFFENSTINMPADTKPVVIGTPSIKGIPVQIVPNGTLKKDEVLVMGSDAKGSAVISGVGNISKPVQVGEVDRIIKEATEKEMEREKERRREESVNFFGTGIFNSRAVDSVSMGCEVKSDKSDWFYREIAGTFVKDEDGGTDTESNS